jgi:hypothetical protein
MEENNSKQLLQVLKDHAVPDPKIVGKLPKGNMQLDFVGHADITRLLIEIDPTWRWVPIAWDEGRPKVHVENGMATMWGELQLLGHARLGVGSVRADKADLDKELVSDFLRNAAMRFGICLSLWTKQEWEDLGGKPEPQKQVGSKAKPAPKPEQTDGNLSDQQRKQFEKACTDSGLSFMLVAANAQVDWDKPVPASQLPALRAAYKELLEFRESE